MALDKKTPHTGNVRLPGFNLLGSRMGPGTSLVVQWLRLHASNAGGVGSVPGWGTEIPYAMGYGKKKAWSNEKLWQFRKC